MLKLEEEKKNSLKAVSGKKHSAKGWEKKMRNGKKTNLGRVQMSVLKIPGAAPCLVKISLTVLFFGFLSLDFLS